RFVNPPSGAAGAPESAQQLFEVSAGDSPTIVATTPESPPQAQLIAAAGVVIAPAGTTSIAATVTPLAATEEQAAQAAQGGAGGIAGNVYRLAIVDQDGRDLAFAAGKQATVILRVPPNVPADMAVARWDGTQWVQLSTATGNQADLFRAQTAALGDFTLIPKPGGAGLGIVFLAAIAVLALLILAGAVLFARRRTGPPPRATSRPTRTTRRG
ncbi:MAG TPA: hypothetical protein VFI22_16885, partial [Thermomicrobiales bacterium]|nr:hypothetical protein [Thermomicrobiales bacterium]